MQLYMLMPQRGFYLLGNNFLMAGRDVDEMTRHIGVANGKCETARDGENTVFLCEPETF